MHNLVIKYSISYSSIYARGQRILSNPQNLSDVQEAQQIIQLNEEIKNEQKIDLEDNQINVIEEELVYQFPQRMKIVEQQQIGEFLKQYYISPHVSLLHSIAHIEYNAMKTYLDTAIRFPYQLSLTKNLGGDQSQLQEKFIFDAMQVAAEEANHFILLQNRLQKLQIENQQLQQNLGQLYYFYGSIPQIKQIRQNAIDTKENLYERLAITSMVQEGKGLDSGQRLLQKLQNFEDLEGKKILTLILKEEVGHVKFGRFWFETYCQLYKKNIYQTFKEVCTKHNYEYTANKQFNKNARLKAGFSEEWFSQVFSNK